MWIPVHPGCICQSRPSPTKEGRDIRGTAKHTSHVRISFWVTILWPRDGIMWINADMLISVKFFDCVRGTRFKTIRDLWWRGCVSNFGHLGSQRLHKIFTNLLIENWGGFSQIGQPFSDLPWRQQPWNAAKGPGLDDVPRFPISRVIIPGPLSW